MSSVLVALGRNPYLSTRILHIMILFNEIIVVILTYMKKVVKLSLNALDKKLFYVLL